jgi:membrane-associated phospholipid phosphatase
VIPLSFRRFAATAVAAACALPMQTLSAQLAPLRDTSESHNEARLFTTADAALAVGFAGLTVAMFPLDKTIARRLEHDTLAKGFVDHGATAFELLSVPGAYIIGPALYVYGRFGHHAGVEDVGLHSTEAVLLATGITEVLKGGLGRSRPYVTRDTNPHDFSFGKGFTGEDRSSFPSAHTAVAFAAASSVTSELAHLWPGHTVLVAPVLYGGATLVGVGRMYHDKHWASDVVLGAGLGIFSGLKVVRYAHDHPDNYFDRMLLHTSVAPDGLGGVAVAWTMPLPQ